MIVLLLVFFLALLFFLYKIHKNDFMYPSIMMVAVYIICTTFAIYNWQIWDMDSYSGQAVYLTIIAVTMFSIVGILVERAFFINRHYLVGRSDRDSNAVKEINVSLFVLILNFIVCLISLLWNLLVVRRIAGGETWFDTMSLYRKKVSYGVLSSDESIPSLLLQLRKYVSVQGFFFSFVLVNNTVVRKFKKRDILLIAPIIISGLLVISNASRLEILQLIASIIVAVYIMWHRKNGWDRNISGKLIRIGFLLFVGVLALFYLTRELVGRGGDFDPLYYISIYVGGSIKLFDMYVKKPILASSIWGKESFYTLNQFLSKFGNDHDRYIRHLEFRFVRDYNVGNVYTAIRRYIQDFGVSGMVVLVCLFSLIMSSMYCSVKYSTKRALDFKLMVFCYLFSSILLFPIDDIFYSSMISPSYLINILLMYGLYFITVK